MIRILDLLNRWCYGGQDKEFFISNEEHIEKNNYRITQLLMSIIGCISVCYYVFSGIWMRDYYSDIVILVFGIMFLFASYLLRKYKHPSVFVMKIVNNVAVGVFSLFLLHHNFSQPDEPAVLIPVYLTVLATIYIAPMYVMMGHDIIIITFIVVCTYIFKPDYFMKDVIDCLICAIIGVSLGQKVLTSRISEIVLLNRIKRDVKDKDAKISVAMDLAHTDGLTGIKNKSAYTQTEEAINERIRAGERLEFAIVVCDVNGLKLVNDKYGHVEGDKLVCNAAQIICDVFKHSPVFRIGGDEFVAILMESDYVNRFRLYSQMGDRINSNIEKGNVSFACGMSIYDAYKDKEVVDVFKRADRSMYNDKRRMHAVSRRN